MKNTHKILIVVVALAAILSIDWAVQAGIVSFRASVASALNTEFTAAQSNRIGNAFAGAYRIEYEEAINANLIQNTAAGRRQFAAQKIVDFTKAIVERHEQNEINRTAVPTPTPLPQE